MKEKQKWLVLEEDGWTIIIPDFDSKPHSASKRGKKRQLAWLNCPCEPLVNGLDRIIEHQSFIDKERIQESMDKIFGA